VLLAALMIGRPLIGSAGASVGGEREASRAIGAAAVLHLRLGQSDGSDLRPGVNDVRNRLVVHVRRLAGDHLGGDHALFFGFVRQHRSGDAVADGVDVRQVRAHLIVDENFAARAEVQPECLGVDAGGRQAPRSARRSSAAA